MLNAEGLAVGIREELGGGQRDGVGTGGCVAGCGERGGDGGRREEKECVLHIDLFGLFVLLVKEKNGFQYAVPAVYKGTNERRMNEWLVHCTNRAGKEKKDEWQWWQ